MLEEFLTVIESFIRNIGGRSGKKIRQLYYKGRLGRCGRNVIIEPGVFFQNPKFIFLGDNIWIDRYTILVAGPFSALNRKFIKKENSNYMGEGGQLMISDGTHVAPFALLQAHGGLSIGKNVTIAAGAKVYSTSHHYKNLNDSSDHKRYSFSTMAPAEDQFIISSPVVIGENCAVGLNSVVLPGTTLRDGSWLGVLAHLDTSSSDEAAIYTSEPAHKNK
ncbi:MAG: hypothetical protein HYR67_06165 [Bacteroidetes bacterium]|nr:hypothetical protein [Bacteroidota bacterium]